MQCPALSSSMLVQIVSSQRSTVFLVDEASPCLAGARALFCWGQQGEEWELADNRSREAAAEKGGDSLRGTDKPSPNSWSELAGDILHPKVVPMLKTAVFKIPSRLKRILSRPK